MRSRAPIFFGFSVIFKQFEKLFFSGVGFSQKFLRAHLPHSHFFMLFVLFIITSNFLTAFEVVGHRGSRETRPENTLAAEKIGTKILSPDQSLLNKAIVENMHTKGFIVIPWTANDPIRWDELMHMGVDGIVTDYPDNLVQFLKKTESSAKVKQEDERVCAQEPPCPLPIKEIQEKLETLLSSGQLSGVVRIQKGQHPCYTAISGPSTAALNPLNLQTQFLIGSLTKQFTAAALLKAFSLKNADVKQELARPLSSFLPENHPVWKEKMPSWANSVTVHQLLVHTSGIPEYTEEAIFQKEIDAESEKRFYEDAHSSGSIVALVKEHGLLFPSGTKYCYSNTNYLLLSEIVTAVSSQPFPLFLEEQFFIPLGMQDTHNPSEGNVKDLQTQDKFAHLADPLIFDLDSDSPFSSLATHIDLSNAQGAGSIISTAEDLMKWNIALHIDKKVLPNDLYELMTANHIAPISDDDGEGYGLGIVKGPLGTLFGYQGRIDSFNALLLYSPNQEISFAILSNSDTGYELLWNALEEVLEGQDSSP